MGALYCRVTTSPPRRSRGQQKAPATTRNSDQGRKEKTVVTPKIYIDANAPTVAEGAIRGAYWYGVNPYQTIEKSIGHAAQYAVPKGEYRAAILYYMEPALASPEGLAKLIKRNGWHSPGPQTVKALLARDWETAESPAQILKAIRQTM